MLSSGSKKLRGKSLEEINVENNFQFVSGMRMNWPDDTSAEEALQNLIEWMEEHHLTKINTRTQIIIVPGYQLKIAQALITNFHQPRSTLLLLVAAVAGKEWKKIYEYALKNDFRFLSYGDACLIWDEKK